MRCAARVDGDLGLEDTDIIQRRCAQDNQVGRCRTIGINAGAARRAERTRHIGSAIGLAHIARDKAVCCDRAFGKADKR